MVPSRLCCDKGRSVNRETSALTSYDQEQASAKGVQKSRLVLQGALILSSFCHVSPSERLLIAHRSVSSFLLGVFSSPWLATKMSSIETISQTSTVGLGL